MSKSRTTSSLDEPDIEFSPDQQAIRDQVAHQLKELQARPGVSFISQLDPPMELVIRRPAKPTHTSQPHYVAELLLKRNESIYVDSIDDALAQLRREFPELVEIVSIRKVSNDA